MTHTVTDAVKNTLKVMSVGHEVPFGFGNCLRVEKDKNFWVIKYPYPDGKARLVENLDKASQYVNEWITENS